MTQQEFSFLPRKESINTDRGQCSPVVATSTLSKFNMAQQEEGWPLGLQPLNVRVGLGFGRSNNFSGSISFNTLLTGSPTSSTDSSSDLDTESTGSFFHDKSITLGSLIGVSSIVELSKRSVRVTKVESPKDKKGCNKSRTWLFSLCSRDTTDADNTTSPPSLGHFLAAERRAANDNRRNQSPYIYGLDEFAFSQANSEPNSLFLNGQVMPPRGSPWHGSENRLTGGLDDYQGNIGNAAPVLFSCMCGQPSHN